MLPDAVILLWCQLQLSLLLLLRDGGGGVGGHLLVELLLAPVGVRVMVLGWVRLLVLWLMQGDTALYLLLLLLASRLVLLLLGLLRKVILELLQVLVHLVH